MTRVKFEDIEFQQLLNENQTQAQKKLAEQFGMTGESIGIQEGIIIDKVFQKRLENYYTIIFIEYNNIEKFIFILLEHVFLYDL